jgi:hypothetical protein
LNISLCQEQQFTSSTTTPKAGSKMLRGYHLQRLLLLLGIGTYVYHNYDDATNSQNLGTYDDPEEAFRATQKHCPYCLVM